MMPGKYIRTDEFKKRVTGWKHTEESKEKIRLKRIGKYNGKNNPFFGKHHTTEFKLKMSLLKKGKMMGIDNPNYGEKSIQWKGDNVGLNGLHRWITRYKPKPELCEECKIKPPTDASNISGEYKRDINDFRWLCHRCNLIGDGVLLKLQEINKKRRENSN